MANDIRDDLIAAVEMWRARAELGAALAASEKREREMCSALAQIAEECEGEVADDPGCERERRWASIARRALARARGEEVE